MSTTFDDPGEARRFLYRVARYKTDLRMDFEVGETVYLGICRSLSSSGLKGEFLDTLATGTAGLLTLYHADSTCAVHATVDTSTGYEVRLGFSLAADAERQLLESFILQTQEPDPIG